MWCKADGVGEKGQWRLVEYPQQPLRYSRGERSHQNALIGQTNENPEQSEARVGSG